jgi:hypothetical protein
MLVTNLKFGLGEEVLRSPPPKFPFGMMLFVLFLIAVLMIASFR